MVLVCEAARSVAIVPVRVVVFCALGAPFPLNAVPQTVPMEKVPRS
jgi:hypothetical protein